MDEYAADVISLPTTNEGWLEVAGDFEARWNLSSLPGSLGQETHPHSEVKEFRQPLLQLQAVLLGCPNDSCTFKVPVPVDRCGRSWPSI